MITQERLEIQQQLEAQRALHVLKKLGMIQYEHFMRCQEIINKGEVVK